MRISFKLNTLLLLLIFTSPVFSQDFTWDVDSGCAPLRVRFTIDPGSIDTNTITATRWDFGNGIVLDTTRATSVETIFRRARPFNIRLLINNDASLSASRWYDGTLPPLNSSFDVLPIDGEPPHQYEFIPRTDTSDQSARFQIAWEHYEGTTLLKPRISRIIDHTRPVDISDQITYPDTGIYRAVLMVRKIHATFACQARTDSIIPVLAEFNVPNVYAPNSGRYYTIDPRDPGVVLSFQLFSRTGIKVFEQEAPAINWDGRNSSGQLLSSGVYFYIIEATRGDLSGFYTKKGFIHLFR